MSYCRFQNTLTDLRDCAEHLDDTDLSPDEIWARDALIKVCQELVDGWEYPGADAEPDATDLPY